MFINMKVKTITVSTHQGIEGKEIADVLGKFFASVFTMEDDGDNILPAFKNRVKENNVLN